MLAREFAVRPKRSSRRRRFWAAILLCLFLPGTIGGFSRADAGSSQEDGSESRLTIESVRVEGNSRTSDALALEAARLAVGTAATPASILGATERLRSSGFFRKVEVSTRRGSAPGRVRVIFVVEEHRPNVRFGLGHEDFSGWYLIPIQLSLDNLTGRGETMRLSSRLGYRVSGLVLDWRSKQLPETKTVFGIGGRVEALERIYFVDDTEISHLVSRAVIDFRLTRRVSTSLALEGWVAGEKVVPDSSAKVYRDSKVGELRRGDEVAFEEIPGRIRRDLAEAAHARGGIALVLGRTTGEGLLTRGLRGRVALEGVRSSEASFGLWQADLRAYLPVREGLQLASRLRAGSVSSNAPFYERFYLGGLYTVRGYPSQSLSPSHGHLNTGTASVELRSAWIGPAARPRLVGTLFCDLALGANGGLPGADDLVGGIGYGLRYRLPWVDWVGLDVGHPLSPAPVDESFHLNLSIGKSF